MNNDRAFLVRFIQQTYPVADNVALNIANSFKPVHFSKNDLILKYGKVSDEYIILEKGCARAYTYDTEGNEVTTVFCSEQSVVFEVTSFFKRTPSKENIQALTNCTGWKVSFEELNHLFHTIPDFREFGRMILVNCFVAFKERMRSMITDTAEQRYEQLLLSNPEILQHAPLKNIASFLGITDTSLSRIRKESSR